MSEYTPTVTGTGARARVQKFGSYLSGMVMPNIGAFIAWGLITALFIPTGWLPNETLAKLVGPMILTLLPLLIGYTGGRMVHGQRGGVVGAVATMGIIVGSDVPMFLGAMIIGPLAAYVIKMVDGFIQERTKVGFEMLVDNFTAGIIAGAMAIVGLLGIGPVVTAITDVAGKGVGFLVDHSLLPLASVIIEPAKVLFMNNAINHGVLTPLGAAQASVNGKSILFMLESNPGPGMGILIAFLFFGPRVMRPTVPAAMIIHFFGGIHEIYFPYVLMKPRLILAAIAGGASGILTFLVFGGGLVAAPAPGSIFAYAAMTPRGGLLVTFLGVVVAGSVSFAVASVLLGFGRGEKAELTPEDMAAAAYREESDAKASPKSPTA
jgi:PTS system mannitol-specific IIC component